MKTILILGGARSGKSHFAQELAAKTGQPVLFVATAEALDEDMRTRIAAHKKARPPAWTTLEASSHIGGRIQEATGGVPTVIIDCITLLVSNIFNRHTLPASDQIDAALVEKETAAEIAELIRCINAVKADFIIVSNEVGLGLVPANRLSRVYRDVLGRTNQLLAQRADIVYLMVAGIPVSIKPG